MCIDLILQSTDLGIFDQQLPVKIFLHQCLDAVKHRI